MIEIFTDIKIDKSNITCHSGGATGADTLFEQMGLKVGVKTKAYSYRTNIHTSVNKVEISESDYQEGIKKVAKANTILNRYGINKYMNLLARNWCQIKYSNQIIAIGVIINPGEISSRGYRCNSKYQCVDGGTGYACAMAIQEEKPLFVFDQIKEKWFRWSYDSMSFLRCECPSILSQDFAGIGTRGINKSGINAIKDVYKKTFNLK